MKEITDTDETSSQNSRRKEQREERENFLLPGWMENVNPQIQGALRTPTRERPIEGQPSAGATSDLGLPLLRAPPTAWPGGGVGWELRKGGGAWSDL